MLRAELKTSYRGRVERAEPKRVGALFVDSVPAKARGVKILAGSAAHVAPARPRGAGPSRRLLAPARGGARSV